MALFIVLLILALIVFGVGFAVHLLWWLLIVLLVNAPGSSCAPPA